MENKRTHTFIYESWLIAVLYVIISWLWPASLYAVICSQFNQSWIQVLFGIIGLLSLVSVYFVPKVYTYKRYGIITENGIELRLRFRTRILQWSEIENIRFQPDLAISHKNRGLFISVKKSFWGIHLGLSPKDTSHTLQQFYQALSEEYRHEEIKRSRIKK